MLHLLSYIWMLDWKLSICVLKFEDKRHIKGTMRDWISREGDRMQVVEIIELEGLNEFMDGGAG